jgi:hypothetical protein
MSDVITKIAGTTLSLSIDLASLSPIDSVIFEVYKTQGRKTKLAYKYPTTEGYDAVDLQGTVYTFVITSEQSVNFSGSYGVEMSWEVGGVVEKAQTTGITYVKQAV